MALCSVCVAATCGLSSRDRQVDLFDVGGDTRSLSPWSSDGVRFRQRERRGFAQRRPCRSVEIQIRQIP